MSASKPKSQKGKPKSKKATTANNNQYLDDNEEFPSAPDDIKKKTETSDHKLKDKAKGLDEDASSDNDETEEKTLENGTKDPSRQNQTKESLKGFYQALSDWLNKLLHLPSSKFGHQNEIISDGSESPKNLFQKLEPYQHKISSVQNIVVTRTKILILAIFWLHVLLWLVLSVVLGIINIFTFLAGPWSLFPIIGWSIVLLGHFLITHHLLKGAGQNDLEWADAKLWEYVDRAKELSYPTYSTSKQKAQTAYSTGKQKAQTVYSTGKQRAQSAYTNGRAQAQTVIIQVRTKLLDGYTYLQPYVHQYLPQNLRQKTA